TLSMIKLLDYYYALIWFFLLCSFGDSPYAIVILGQLFFFSFQFVTVVSRCNNSQCTGMINSVLCRQFVSHSMYGAIGHNTLLDESVKRHGTTPHKIRSSPVIKFGFH